MKWKAMWAEQEFITYITYCTDCIQKVSESKLEGCDIYIQVDAYFHNLKLISQHSILHVSSTNHQLF